MTASSRSSDSSTAQGEFPAAQHEAASPTFWRYGILALLSSVAALAYFSRNTVSVLESTIRKDLELLPSQMGVFMGAFFLSYAIAGVPAGWLGQRWGTRLALALFIAVWSISTALLGFAHHLAMLVAAQLIMGTSQAGLMPCTVNSVSKWFPEQRHAFACACLGAGMQVGAIISGTLTGWLAPLVGWRAVFLMYGLPGIVGAFVFYLLFRNLPEHVRSVNAAELNLIRPTNAIAALPEKPGETIPWREILSSRTLWFLCGQQVFRAAGYMFFASWFPSFLQHTRGVNIADSGMLQSLIFASALGGTYLGGIGVDAVYVLTKSRTLSRVVLAAASLALCGFLVLLAYFAETPSLAVALLSAASLLAAVSGPCAFTAAIDVGGKHTPHVVAIMNTAGNLAAAACPVVVGVFFAATHNWDLILWGFACIYLAGAACWVFVDVEHPIAMDASAVKEEPSAG